MLNLLEGVILVVSLLVIFAIIERIRIATGKEVYTAPRCQDTI